MSLPSTSSPFPTEKTEFSRQQWLQAGSDLSKVNGTAHALQTSSCHANPTTVYQKGKRKENRPLEVICGWVVRHQIGLSVNLLLLLSLTHLCFPRARKHTRKFFELSYYNSITGEYRAGWNDAWMVSYWIIIFTGLRAAVMDYILMPLARKGGVKTERDETRFAEQAWLLIYYSIFWTLGMYIMVNSKYWLNLRELWTNWPNREIGALSKWYTLVQYAFWLQQILVINMEKRRKDHWQMFTHHIVTTMLIFTSYGYHQTRVANMVLCAMDVVDLIFPVAKCLKYLGYHLLCDIAFGIFMLTWVIARHVIYMTICYSVWKHIPEEIAYGCYSGINGKIIGPFPSPDRFRHLLQPFLDPEGVVCWDNGIKWYFLGTLLFLQGITLMWFLMIVRVAIRVLKGGEAEDTRSDDEEVDEAVDESLGRKVTCPLEHPQNADIAPFEEEVGVEAINLKGRVSNASRNRYRKGTSSATGVSLPGHSDRKELLGRIGCDKGI